MPIKDHTKKILRSSVPVWKVITFAVLLTASVSLALWIFSGRNDQPGVRRWASGGNLRETAAFAEMIKHTKGPRDWQRRPNDTKEPITATRDLDYAYPRVSVYSVPNIRPTHALPTLKDLAERAQVRAIDAIEHAAGTESRPWEDLQKALSSDSQPGEKDPFFFERVLVATVAKGTEWAPGDRMVWTRIFVHPVNFKFTAYTIASTENETVKVSSVESTDVRKLSADVGLTVPGLDGSKIGITPSRESTVKTNFDVSTQYERLGVDIIDDFLRIIRESSAGGDIGGNTKIALSMTTDPDAIRTLSESGLPQENEISLVVTNLALDEDGKEPKMDVLPIVPLPHCALKARISAIYEQRHIISGNASFDESRQNVEFFHDVDRERTVDIVGADDVSPFIWRIQMVPNGSQVDNDWNGRRVLRARFDHTGELRPLVFSDYGRAVKLAHWVRTQNGKKPPSGYEFNWSSDYGLVVVKQLKDECKVKVGQPALEPSDAVGQKTSH